MAIIAAFADPATFTGFSVREDVRPPAVQLRENDPATPLHVLLRSTGAEEPPNWVQMLKRVGYAVMSGEDRLEVIAKFVWTLGRV